MSNGIRLVIVWIWFIICARLWHNYVPLQWNAVNIELEDKFSPEEINVENQLIYFHIAGVSLLMTK